MCLKFGHPFNLTSFFDPKMSNCLLFWVGNIFDKQIAQTIK